MLLLIRLCNTIYPLDNNHFVVCTQDLRGARSAFTCTGLWSRCMQISHVRKFIDQKKDGDYKHAVTYLRTLEESVVNVNVQTAYTL